MKRNVYSVLSSIFNISYFKYVNVLAKSADGNSREVIDLGCGSGVIVKAVSEMFPEYDCVGVDLIQTNTSRGNLTFLKEDIRNFVKVKDFSRCSLVIMNDVLEHFEYSEIISVLSVLIEKMPAGSYLCFQFPNMSSPFGLRNYFGDCTHKTPLTDKTIRELLSKFSDIKFQIDGVDEVGSLGIISLLLAFLYWKFIVRVYDMLFRFSIGWNKHFFHPNLCCVVQKSGKLDLT